MTKISYSYKQDWSEIPQTCTQPDYQNPSFPSGLRGGTEYFTSNGLRIGAHDKLYLNSDLVDQVNDWVPLVLNSDTLPEQNKLPYDLKLSKTKTALINGKSSWGDSVGDLRVTYKCVLANEYTTVSKLHVQDGKNHLVPFKGGLKDSLASQGEITAPEELNELLGIQMESFVIPETIVQQMENILLKLAPLQINYIGSGRKSL